MQFLHLLAYLLFILKHTINHIIEKIEVCLRIGENNIFYLSFCSETEEARLKFPQEILHLENAGQFKYVNSLLIIAAKNTILSQQLR